RENLYEHEVYEILAEIGLLVPRFACVRGPAEVGEETLRRFGREIVVKVVSSRISHKQKLGGVRRIKNGDRLFVQYVMDRMAEEVASHFLEGGKPPIEGFLLVEYVPHTQALGYEVLIGFKEDSAFGPVVTLTKGGDDAEFFAEHFSPANLFLPPLGREEALEALQVLHIRHKFNQFGHGEYLATMAGAMARLSELAYYYSEIGRERPAFTFKSFEVNPFVFTEDGRFIALDGFAQFAHARAPGETARGVRLAGLHKFFRPQGVAVVGVSGDPGKQSLGREIAHLLRDLGREDLHFINPRGGSIVLDGAAYPLKKTLSEIGRAVDLAVYAAPAQYAVDFIRDAAGAGIQAVILISGLPAEIRYADYARELDSAVPEGMRVIGPNCMGVYVAPEVTDRGLNTFFIDERRLAIRPAAGSNTVFLTQSGALAVTAVDMMQNAGIFRYIVSFGNKYDVEIADLLAYFAGMPEIGLIALYAEGLKPGEGRRFFELARGVKKPIVVYKSGKSEAGARAAASHTASMTGSYEVFKAACQQAGVILAAEIDEFYDCVKSFSLLAGKAIASRRVAGVVNAGFESTVGADELKGLRQAELSPETVARLNGINAYGLVDTSSPFLDITPMADDRMYAEFTAALLEDPGVDCVFVAVIPHAPSLKTLPENCRDADGLASLLVSLGKKTAKPMVVSVNGGRHYHDFVAVLEEGGLPVYTDIRAAIKALDAFVSYRTRA
ncbi:MAG: acetate--CoA ligase family protein, partial [Patescibacteria group bacterium]